MTSGFFRFHVVSVDNQSLPRLFAGHIIELSNTLKPVFFQNALSLVAQYDVNKCPRGILIAACSDDRDWI